jgi:hypothetical protein
VRPRSGLLVARDGHGGCIGAEIEKISAEQGNTAHERVTISDVRYCGQAGSRLSRNAAIPSCAAGVCDAAAMTSRAIA